MNRTVVGFGILSAAILCSELRAQSDFFWSLADLNSGATNSAVDAQFNQGDTGSLFIYYTTNGPANSDLSTGAFLDIESSNSGVIQFTGAETFDFRITENDTTIGYRWTDGLGGGGFAGPSNNFTDDFIDEFRAFTIAGGPGIQEINTGPVFIDHGYDADADAFLWGKVDFLVIGEAGSSTELFTESGDGYIVNGSQIVDASFGSATITVGIPEPTAVVALALAILGTAFHRRRT